MNSSVKVIDLNNEAVEEEPTLKPIEEATEEQTPEQEIVNDVVEEVNQEPKEEPIKEKPKRQTQKDRIQCPKCLKEVSLKTYRYSHEKNCGGQLSEKPVKPHTKPKPKPKPKQVHEVLSNKRNPKPPPDVYYSESDDDDDASPEARDAREPPQQPLIKNKQSKPKQPSNPLLDITNSYALLQQQMMQQRQEKYNKVCAGMFGPRTKKR